MARERVRDTEALKVASDIVREVDVTEDQRATAVIVGARAYRRGRNVEARFSEATALERDRLRERLDRERHSRGLGPNEVHYIQTLCRYGMEPNEVAPLFGVETKVIEDVLRDLKQGVVRFASAPPKPGSRVLDA